MVVRVRKKAGYAVYNPFPHRFVFSLFLHSYSTCPHRYFAFISLFLYSFHVFFKASFILYKSDQLISSCVQHVCSLNLQAES